MKVKLFANLADLAGTREIHLDRPGDGTVGEVVDAVIEEYPSLDGAVRTDEGELEEHINVLVDGANVRHDEDGLDMTVDEDGEVAIFPPVSGG